MDDQERLAQALGRGYTVAVQTKGNGYVLFIRELGLRHQSDDLVRGHAELLEKKDAWIRDLAQEGLWDWIVPPGGTPGLTSDAAPAPAGRFRGLLPFFIKFGCVVLLLLVVSAKLSDAGRDVGYTLEKKLDNIVAMQPETVEKHRAKAHAIAVRLRPIVLEVLSIFRPESDPQSGSQVVSSAAPGAAASQAGSQAPAATGPTAGSPAAK